MVDVEREYEAWEWKLRMEEVRAREKACQKKDG